MDRRKFHGCWGAIAALVLLASCNSTPPKEELQGYLETRIPDQAAAASLLDLADTMNRQIADYETIIVAFDAALQELNRNYETENAEIERLMRLFSAAQAKHRDAILSTSLEMRSLVTQEEWKKISSLQIALITRAMNRAGRI